MRALPALALALWLAAAPSAQVVDSLAAPAEAALPDSLGGGRTPRGAVTRALIVPGLGQVYNRQPVKAPVATALVVGAVVYFVDRQRQYTLYRRAAAFATCRDIPGDPETSPERFELCEEPLAEYGDEFETASERVATPTFATLSSVRSRARGQRDIGGVVVLAAYALQALDAYVSAELADFDVSEDLSLGVDATPAGPALGLRVRL